MFEREIEVYNKWLPQMLTSEGKFALVFGDELLGIFDTQHDALTAGYMKCGFETPFLVKQIWRLSPSSVCESSNGSPNHSDRS
jgi:hypothetical protein